MNDAVERDEVGGVGWDIRLPTPRPDLALRGGGRRVCHGAPATSAPVDHASRAGWGRTVRPTARNGARLEGELASGRSPRRSARLTSGSRRTGRGLVVWRGSRAEGGPGGSQRGRGGPSSTEWGRRLERAAATPAVVARRTARPGRPALWAGTGPASRRGRSPTSRRGARLRIDRKPPPCVSAVSVPDYGGSP